MGGGFLRSEERSDERSEKPPACRLDPLPRFWVSGSRMRRVVSLCEALGGVPEGYRSGDLGGFCDRAGVEVLAA